MFNFRRNNEERKFKGNTIYVLKYDDLPIEQILNIIVKNIEAYTKLIFILVLTYETIRKISCYNLPPNEFYQNDFCEVYRK